MSIASLHGGWCLKAEHRYNVSKVSTNAREISPMMERYFKDDGWEDRGGGTSLSEGHRQNSSLGEFADCL